MRGDKKKLPLSVLHSAMAVSWLASRDATAKTLKGLIRKHVVPGSVVYTDEFPAYNTIPRASKYVHHRIRHADGVYVRGDIHTIRLKDSGA